MCILRRNIGALLAAPPERELYRFPQKSKSLQQYFVKPHDIAKTIVSKVQIVPKRCCCCGYCCDRR